MTPREVLAQAVRDGRLALDSDEVAIVLGVSRWTVYDRVAASDFPIAPIRVGRRIKFRVSDVAELVGFTAPAASSRGEQ